MLARLVSAAKRIDDLAEALLLKVVWPAVKQRRAHLLVWGVVAALSAYKINVDILEPERARAPEPEITDGAFLLDRPWIDNLPREGKDRFALWFFSDHARRGGGGLWSVYQHGKAAKWNTEVFLMRPEGCKLHLRSQHDKRAFEVHYKITHEKRQGVDLKMVIKNDPHHGGQDHVYWSRMDKWRRSELGDPASVARALIAMPQAEE